MAEPRRIGLSSAPLPIDKEVPRNSAVDKDKDGISYSTVYFDTKEPTEEFCPIYDYEKLLAEQKKTDKTMVPETSDPFGEADSEKKLASLAKHFEEKYGPRDLRELGAGYDQDDAFVDDSESAEAMIPSGWTTQHGGFYISTGPLHIRLVQPEETDSQVYKSVNTEECLTALKNMNIINGKRKVREESSEVDSEEEARKARRKRALLIPKEGKPSAAAVADGNQKKTIPRTVASILAEKRSPSGSDADDSRAEGKLVDKRNVNPNLALKDVQQKQTQADLEVANRKAILKKTEKDKELKIDRADGSATNSPTTTIPEEITDGLRSLILELEEIGKTWNGGKTGFFSSGHNQVANTLLLELEYECRQLRCGLRSTVFSYLANHLPSSKETIIKRARKLRLDDVSNRLKDVMSSLERSLQEDPENGIDPATKHLKPVFKKLIGEAVQLKMAVYDLFKANFTANADYIQQFIDNELMPLWKGRAVDKAGITSEAFMALAEALRPKPYPPTSKFALVPSSSSMDDFDMPPAIVAPTLIEKPLPSSRPSAKPSLQDSRIINLSTAPVTVLNPRSSVTKVQYMTKQEAQSQKETKSNLYDVKVAKSSGTERPRLNDAVSGSIMRPQSGDHVAYAEKGNKRDGRNTPNVLHPSRPAVSVASNMPAARASSKASSSNQSGNHRSSFAPPNKPIKVAHEQPSRHHVPAAESESFGESSKQHSSSSKSSKAAKHSHADGGRRHIKAEAQEAGSSNADSGKILAHTAHPILVATDLSGRNSGESSKSSKAKGSKSGSSSVAAYNPNSNYSAVNISSPFVNMHNTAMMGPLMLPLTATDMFAMSIAAGSSPYSSLIPAEYFMQSGGMFGGGAGSYSRNGGSGASKSSSSQASQLSLNSSDSPFVPRT